MTVPNKNRSHVPRPTRKPVTRRSTARHQSRRVASAGEAPGEVRRFAPGSRGTAADHGYLLWILFVFLVLEYARPPLIVQLRLQLLIILVLPLLCLTQLRDRTWSGILIAQVLFVLLCAVGVPFASNNYAAYFTTRTMFGNVAIAVSMMWVVTTRHALDRTIWVWLWVMCYVALYALTHEGVGPGGFVADENDLALGCVTAFPFTYFGFQSSRGWRRWVYAVLGVIFVMAIVVSFSRGGFVGLAAVALYCVFASRNRLRNFALMGACSLVLLALAPRPYIEELRTISDPSNGTARSRQFLWVTAFNMWKQHPIIGVGGGNFIHLAGEFQPDWEERRYAVGNWSGTTVHSAIFEVLSEQGLAGIGLSGYILFAHFHGIGRLRRRARRHQRVPAHLRRHIEIYGGGLTAGMVGFLASGVFLSVAYTPYPWYFSALGVALATGTQRELRALTRVNESA